jgi:hypothetical protein
MKPREQIRFHGGTYADHNGEVLGYTDKMVNVLVFDFRGTTVATRVKVGSFKRKTTDLTTAELLHHQILDEVDLTFQHVIAELVQQLSDLGFDDDTTHELLHERAVLALKDSVANPDSSSTKVGNQKVNRDVKK